MRKGTVMVRDAGERTDLRGEEVGGGQAESVGEGLGWLLFRLGPWGEMSVERTLVTLWPPHPFKPIPVCGDTRLRSPELEASLNSVPVLDQLEEIY